jgi:hypothetical protein
VAKFIVGVLVGIFLGASATAYGAGASRPGTVPGWTVAKDGEPISISEPAWTGGPLFNRWMRHAAAVERTA